MLLNTQIYQATQNLLRPSPPLLRSLSPAESSIVLENIDKNFIRDGKIAV